MNKPIRIMNTSSVKYRLLLFINILIFSLIGCRGELSHMNVDAKLNEGNVLARVGDETITNLDLEAALERMPKRKHQALMHRVLDDLIEARVFSNEAKKRGLDEDPNVRQTLEKIGKEILAGYFVKKYIDKQAEPSEKVLEKYYLDHQDQFLVPESVLIQHIVVEEEGKAREMVKALNAGEPLEAIAEKNSICRCYEKGGEHGWFYREKMEPDLEKIAFHIEKGTLSGVIKTKAGYQVIKVLDRRDHRQVPFEEAKPKIHPRLFWEEKRKVIDKYYEAAKVDTNPTEEGVLAKIGDEAISEEMLAPILAKLPENKKMKAKRRWIDYFIETRVFSEEAKKVRLSDDPDVARELRRRTDQVLANVFRKRFINDKFPITDMEIKDYYQSHPEAFKIPLKVRAKSILVKTREEAEEILEEIKEGTPFGYMATKKSLYPRASERAGEIGWFGKGEKDPALEKVAFSLEIEEISDIIKTGAGYEIIKLMNKKGGEIRPLEEVEQSIKMTLLMQRFEEEKQRYYQKAGVKVLGP